MTVTCCFRYTLHPFKIEGFEAYARLWAERATAAGGRLLGSFLPRDSKAVVAVAIASFDSEAALDAFRDGLRRSGTPADRCILSEECILLRALPGLAEDPARGTMEGWERAA